MIYQLLPSPAIYHSKAEVAAAGNSGCHSGAGWTYLLAVHGPDQCPCGFWQQGWREQNQNDGVERSRFESKIGSRTSDMRVHMYTYIYIYTISIYIHTWMNVAMAMALSLVIFIYRGIRVFAKVWSEEKKHGLVLCFFLQVDTFCHILPILGAFSTEHPLQSNI